MERNDLISTCRFYNGGLRNPFKFRGDTALLWEYEQAWVNDSIAASKRSDREPLSSMLDEYLAAGLREFSNQDGIPVTLKAYLFNRYAKGSNSMADAVEPFKAFYLRYYGRK